MHTANIHRQLLFLSAKSTVRTLASPNLPLYTTRHSHSMSHSPKIHPVIDKILREQEPNATLIVNRAHGSVESSTGHEYFIKTGPYTEAEQYNGEAESLKALNAAAPGLAPRLLSYVPPNPEDEQGGGCFWVSEYKCMGPLTESAARKLGKRLATEVHRHTSAKGFGFEVPTFCGRTKQYNGWFDTWEQCFDAQLGSLLDRLPERFGELRRKGAEIRSRVIPALLGPLDIEPVLLHGDLWSGNTGTDTQTGEPVIFDPSSYYGHNEADLGIARMFGGFPQIFWLTYHKHLPKAAPVEQYELRSELYQLYHYVNHTLLFGGGYASSAESKMDILLRAFPKSKK